MQNYFDQITAFPRRIIEKSYFNIGIMFILIFAMILPVLFLVPTVTRAVSDMRSPYSIQRREVFLLGFLMLFYGLLVRRLEEESFWKLALIGVLMSVWGAMVLAYCPPFI